MKAELARTRLLHKYRNRLLTALSDEDLALLEPHLSAVTLDRRKQLEYPNRKIESVYFIDRGIASVMATIRPNLSVEVGLIGCEGMTGVGVLLGGTRTIHSTLMQLEGNGHMISFANLRKAMDESNTLQNALLRYAYTFLVQVTQTAVTNAKASIEQRLARWLLMAYDRIDGDTINLTHELLALMLGTRRPGVTDAIQSLVKRGLLRNERGVIVIADQKGLEKHAAGFYGVPESEFDRLIG